MTTHDDGGAAYPTMGDISHNADWITDEGMTLLDHFAGLAMQPLLHLCDQCVSAEDAAKATEMVPRTAYDVAELMIAEKRRRESEPTEETQT